MTRPVTLFTGQWADLPLEVLAAKASAWGFDGLELACWGDHFEVDRALAEPDYVAGKLELLERHGLVCRAIGAHLVGQAVCDPIDARHRGVLPDDVWGDGDPEGVRFALEVHPTEIAYDFVTTRKALDAIGHREGFAHQFLDSAAFVEEFADRIYHVHVKDSRRSLDGRRSILGGHMNFGEAGRGWDFVSSGHGDVDFESLLRALNRIGYDGPLSIEWEDAGMDREWGAQDAIAFVRRSDFEPSTFVFDEAMQRRDA
jgi:sugar phosphate isomerase/epimerase